MSLSPCLTEEAYFGVKTSTFLVFGENLYGKNEREFKGSNPTVDVYVGVCADMLFGEVVRKKLDKVFVTLSSLSFSEWHRLC